MPVWVEPDAAPRAVAATITAPVPGLTKVSAQGGPATGTPDSGPSTAVRLLVSSTAAATSPILDRGTYRGPAALVIANVGTGSPTVTVDIQASVDNVNFYNVGYALVATPNTVAVASLTITTTAMTTYLLVTDQAWRYLKVVTSSVTTETLSATYYQ